MYERHQHILDGESYALSQILDLVMIGTRVYRRRKYKTFVYVIGIFLIYLIYHFTFGRSSGSNHLKKYDEKEAMRIIHNKIGEIQQKEKKTPDVNTEDFVDIYFHTNEVFLLVDARDSKERDVSYIPQSISKEEYYNRYNDTNIPAIRVFIYSTIGERSRHMVDKELSRGVRAASINGGIIEWTHYNKPLVNKDGKNVSQVYTGNEYKDLLSENYHAVY
ncbi:hypothetical protein WA158_007025 [Blastocystis sp. Blastoise]